jgi:hypothetical protein
MLSLYSFGGLLWLAYGLLIHAQAVTLTSLETAAGFEKAGCRRTSE